MVQTVRERQTDRQTDRQADIAALLKALSTIGGSILTHDCDTRPQVVYNEVAHDTIPM